MNASPTFRTRRPLNTPEFRGARPREYSRQIADGMIIERDVTVRTREGFDLYVDLFRPEKAEGPLPTLLSWTPYGKHDPAPLATIFPEAGVKAEWQSDYTIFEAPDPVYWTSQGYAVAVADVPGTWYSSTHSTYLDRREAESYYDFIEWAGTCDWSNGKVGLSGVSYLTSSQWQVAALNPPHLAAINPWEGWSDTYNDIVRHGGIPETHFWPYIQVRWGASDTRIEDLWAATREHPFFDEYWQSKVAPLEDVRVPAFVVASWSDHGCHTRGTLEAFKRLGSQSKWLRIHGEKKWANYYDPRSIELQTAFFDHYLKGLDTSVPDWPKVAYQIRYRAEVATDAIAETWPVADVECVRSFLHPDGKMVPAPPVTAGEVSYDPLDDEDGAVFDHSFDENTTLVGNMNLSIEVASEEGDDLDLFVSIDKIDVSGERIGFTHYASYSDGPVALGWLRVSRRELDHDRSTEFQPILANVSERKIAPGEPVNVQIEILPSATFFESGSKLRVAIRGRDIIRRDKPTLYMRHEETVNLGLHRIICGGETPSCLVMPVLRQGDTDGAST